MLTSILGIRLVLWMGKNVPSPAPYEVLTALTKLEVTNDVAESGDGFQMTFSLGKDKTLDYTLLQSDALEPFTRVLIGVLLGASFEVLIDGVITHHQIQPSYEPGMSTLTVTGKDISLMLNLEEKNEKYENQPDSLIVTQVIAKYAQYGLIPQATPTSEVPLLVQRTPRQFETDKKFLDRLAQRNGFVFYIEPLTFGTTTAYWGPENRLDIPQPALTMNMGSYSNLKSLYFSHDALAAIATMGTILEPITKASIPIPSLPSLRVPLAATPTPAKRKILLCDTAKQTFGQGAISAVASVTGMEEAVRGEGEVDTIRYGNILHARKSVGVRGVGSSYDGNYYVRRVTHTISKGDYTQTFTLSREGTRALLPMVRP
ncbi:hypothetical protein H6G93_35160 [Nostoc sp. FACHB-973]|nr:hypothetical protein [Nostoc sp. FACHB-973]